MLHIAAITPRGEQGDIDVGAAFELIDFLCGAAKGQGAGILLFGAAGEYPALAQQDRSRLLYLAVKRSRVPVIAGVGSAALDLSLELARNASDAGVAAMLLPPPYLSRYRQDDIREFYSQFSGHAPGPVYLEHQPELTSGIEVETARELLATGRYEGIVDATGEHAAAGLATVVANDRLLARARCSGAAAISEAACAIPELVMALDSAITGGQAEEAQRLERRLLEFLHWMDAFPRATLLRAAVGLRGIKTGPLPMPLPLEKQRKMDEFREWFADGRWK
jgi:4-hydroxy-tetrahydrodipicolinate synthase